MVDVAGGGEYSLCGDAFDGYKKEQEPMVKTNSTKITCRRCLNVVRMIKEYLSTK